MKDARDLKRIPRTLFIAVSLLLLAAAASDAARPPIGKTYFTVLVGVAAPYDISTACFEFGTNDICSTDGDSCGSWLRTDAQGKRTGFTFDMSLLDDANLVRLQGEGRVDTFGRKSSIGGTGRISGAGPIYNYSFAGREMPKARCQQMLADDPVGDNTASTVVVGSGNIASESRSVSDFSKVVLSGVGRLEIRHTGSESLTVRADDNLLEYMRSEVRNGVLFLGNDPGINFRTDHEVVYLLSVSELDSLTLAGVTFADIRGIDTDLFTLNITGVAAVKARGTADRQRVSGATVRVRERLSGSVKGLSSLEYIGDPTVTVAVDPTSTIRRLR